MFKPRRILWVGAIVGIAYLVWRWRQQQIAELATPAPLPVAPPRAPSAQAMAVPAPASDAAQAAPRRIVTRVHRGAPPTPPAGQPAIVVVNNGAARPANAPSAPEAPAAPDVPAMALGEAPEASAEATMTLAPALDEEPVSETPAGEEPALSPIDLNTADLDALIALPGIGPALAARIISYRDEHGPFTDIEQLVDVQGIGPNNMSDFRHLIYV